VATTSAKRKRGTLDRATIGVAALEIVDAGRAEALTMRSLASKLRCDPMALYRHVDHRDDLLGLVAAMVVESIVIPPEVLDDRKWLRQLLFNLRTTLIDHRNVVPILGQMVLPIGEQSVFIDQLVGRLARNRSTGKPLADRVNLVIGSVLGYLVMELSTPTRPSFRRFTEHEPTQSKTLATLAGKAFGFRDAADVVLLPKGFTLLVDTAIETVLDPPASA
jgi:AcrR family transcriptional regulator